VIKLSLTQLQALRASAQHHLHTDGYSGYHIALPTDGNYGDRFLGVRTATVEALLKRGLLRRTDQSDVVITAEGIEALEDHEVQS